MGFGFGGPNGVYHSYYDNFDWMSRHADPGFAYHATATRLATLCALRLADAEVLPFTVADYPAEITRQLDSTEKKYGRISHPVFDELRRKAEEWRKHAVVLDSLLLVGRGSGTRARSVNDILMSFERIFAAERGIPGREWYKHRVVAASGYASVGLPGITGAVEKNDGKTLDSELRLFDQLLDRAIAATKNALSLLQ